MKLITAALALVMATSVSAENGCEWNGNHVPAGKSVYVQDPVLVQMTVDHFVKKGFTPEAAQKRAESGDWVGYVLECVAVFSPGEETSDPGKIIKSNGYQLVLIDHQRDWHADISEQHP